MSPKIGPKKVKNTIIVHVNDQVVIKYRASTWQVRNAGARFQVSGSKGRCQVQKAGARFQVSGFRVPGVRSAGSRCPGARFQHPQK